MKKDLKHQEKSSIWSRRQFLTTAGASALVASRGTDALSWVTIGAILPLDIEDPPRLFVNRPHDFLIIEFFFINLKVSSGSGADPLLVRNPPHLPLRTSSSRNFHHSISVNNFLLAHPARTTTGALGIDCDRA